uniref:HERV-H LTR-associating 1 n=1 Tax=Malurus cyaneus samueli TaxID=2593467 RepID=A0A8C5TXB5_9PASS
MSLENCISPEIRFGSHLSFLCLFFCPALFFLSVSCTHTFLPHTDTALLSVSLCPLVPLFFAELPAKSLDLAAINLTELVNGMLSTALRGTKKFFSLLSVTSYSSFAFHKVSVTVYNISNAKNIDPGKFPMHYCYCLNNVTNDLTDFTALLVDIIGNSTSYLTEIFKSTSILSVRQNNDSDCIYICVMAGQTGKRKNMSDFLELLEKSPGTNTPQLPSLPFSLFSLSLLFFLFSSLLFLSLLFSSLSLLSSLFFLFLFPLLSSLFSLLSSLFSLLSSLSLSSLFSLLSSLLSPSPSLLSLSPLSLSLSPSLPPLPLSPLPSPLPSPPLPLLSSLYSEPKDDGIFRGILIFWRCPQAMFRDPRVTSPPVTLMVQKISPCVMELCRFFQLCLCVGQRRYSRKEAMRYCVEYYSWFVKNASYVCERVKRVAYSHTLKQKCLKNICTSV